MTAETLFNIISLAAGSIYMVALGLIKDATESREEPPDFDKFLND